MGNQKEDTMKVRLLRKTEVLGRFPKKNTALYGDIAGGVFPPAVSLAGSRAVGWPEHEVEAVIGAMLLGRTKDDLRALVRELVAARSQLAVMSNDEAREFVSRLLRSTTKTGAAPSRKARSRKTEPCVVAA